MPPKSPPSAIWKISSGKNGDCARAPDCLEMELMEADNAIIGQRLRAAYKRWAMSNDKSDRSIRLPNATDIQFVQAERGLSVCMSSRAVCANMQTNSAAFEGWCLVLRLWLPEIETITLSWTPPQCYQDDPSARHYARFLFRVQRFQEMFPDWFSVGTPHHFDACEIRAGQPLFLNVAGSKVSESPRSSREAQLEAALVDHLEPEMRRIFDLDTLDRQFPVGLYRKETPRKTDAVFTGGTSAIDLIGIGGGTVSVFELKAGPNIMVGALGELIFYARVVQAAVGPQARFEFAKSKAGSRGKIGSHDVKRATAVQAVLLTEQTHPLLEHPNLIPTLNRATAKQTALGSVPLTFAAWTIAGFPGSAVRFAPLSAMSA